MESGKESRLVPVLFFVDVTIVKVRVEREGSKDGNQPNHSFAAVRLLRSDNEMTYQVVYYDSFSFR